jgi:hypothetical protein
MTTPRHRLAAIGLAAAALLAAPAALACPSYNNPTVFGSANIQANFMPDPWVRNVTAGGTVSLQGCGFSWPGYVVSRPDFRFQYSGGSPTGQLTIAIEARSNVDTILLVNAPDGTWHFNNITHLLCRASPTGSPAQPRAARRPA